MTTSEQMSASLVRAIQDSTNATADLADGVRGLLNRMDHIIEKEEAEERERAAEDVKDTQEAVDRIFNLLLTSPHIPVEVVPKVMEFIKRNGYDVMKAGRHYWLNRDE